MKATAEGTLRFVQRWQQTVTPFDRRPRKLGPLHANPFGLGTYRLDAARQSTAESIIERSVIGAGCNVIDTSSHYGSEALIGASLKALGTGALSSHTQVV